MVRLSVLNMKLMRDLWRMRGQVLAVAFVIGSGVATLVMSLSTIEALQATTDTYYQRYRFADVFASATRVPQRVSQKISEIPGVQSLQTRIVHLATLDIDSFEEPVVGQILSVPENGQPMLNQLVLRKGRWVLPEREDEIILSEPFAQAHNLDLGDSITAILNGHKRKFNVVGLALSPEFIYSIGPGSLLPDDKRFGVMWVSREILEAAYDLKESFNDVAIKLLHNTPSDPVLRQLDAILEPYGGIRSITRDDQISNWFVMNEIAQQKTMAKILPAIFLLVSMFLTNMVLSRLIATERTEIGLLKAFGYSSIEIGLHYAKMVIVICIIGIILGSILGAFFGRLNTQMYADLFRFPLLIYQPGPQAFIISGTVSMTVAIMGALGAVKQAVRLPPAEAMTPPSPAIYKNAVASESQLTNWLDQPTRIAIRQISRWPLRSFFTCLGIAMSTGLIIMNLQWNDSLTHLSRVYFFESQHQDIMVSLDNPERLRAIHDFEKISGVLRAEPMNIISVEFISDSGVHRGAIRGILPENQLQPIYDDAKRQRIEVPHYGIVLSTRLAEKLNIGVGGSILLNVLEGKRASVYVEVVDTFEAFIGMPAFMDLNTLNRLVKQSPRFKFVNLLVDFNQQRSIFEMLKNTPRVGAVMLRQSAMDSFNNTIIEHLMVIISMFIGLAFILAFGVTYNSTRIALSERARELATLRVLGFSKGEISYVLLGEVMFLVLLGLPLGFLVGWLLVLSMATAFNTEMFRVPLVIDTSTYGYAAILVILSAVVSAAIVRRRVDKLDLIKVLKTRE